VTLRAAILVGVLALIVAIVATTLFAVDRIIERAAVRSVHEGVAFSRSAFVGEAAKRQTRLQYLTEVVADEPRLKALASSDVDRGTIVDVARDLHISASSDVFVLLDSEGQLIVDMLAPEQEDGDMLGNPVIAEAFERGSAAGIWVDERAVYEVHARRLGLGARTIGVVVLGRRVDDGVIATIRSQIGGPVAVLLDGVPAAVSVPGASEMERDQIGRLLGILEPGGKVYRVSLGGSRFLASSDRFPGYEGGADLRVVVLRDLDQALAPSRRVRKLLYGILVVAVLAAVILALLLSRRLSRPLSELSLFTERIARGELAARARAGGYIEVARLTGAMNRMAEVLAESRAQRAENQRLENELAIAARIQTSILPGPVELYGLEVAALMRTASEVGGDYYDILPAPDGGWLGIGDVAGHGLDAGLIMLMAQTAIATLVAADPSATPAQLMVTLNRVLYGNVKERLGSDRHMTLCLMRYVRDGRVTVAGAHLEILYLPAGDEQCVLLETPGIWMAMVEDIEPVTVDTEYRLEPGDLMVLYTDGLTEGRDAGGEMFGLERVMERVVAERARPVEEICQALYQAAHDWTEEQHDDVTLLVMRYRGERG
jgi:serine phosphatase RsbU (regulator of sigma subunit)